MTDARKRKLLDKWRLQQILQNKKPACENCKWLSPVCIEKAFAVQLGKNQKITNIYPEILNPQAAMKKLGTNTNWICARFTWE
jgi:hypothetical protein